MHSPHYNPPPAQPMAPPTRPGAIPGRRSTWPTVLGVVSIVLASASILWGIFSLILAGVFGGTAHLDTMTLLAAMWDLATSIVLVIVGGGLLGRRRWSIPLALIWAGIEIASVLFSTAYALLADRSDASPVGDWWFAGMFLLGLAWGLFWPIFLLIWLRQSEIRKETAAWR